VGLKSDINERGPLIKRITTQLLLQADALLSASTTLSRIHILTHRAQHAVGGRRRQHLHAIVIKLLS
jgi:hypothetical protein